MGKKVIASLRLHIQGGQASPGPPVGPALGQHGLNIMQFCKAFNADTKDKAGFSVPVDITVYSDRSFTFDTKSPVASDLIRKAAGIPKGSGVPNRDKVGKLTRAQVEEIARTKLADLTAANLEAAMKSIMGTARSMGVEIID